MARSGGPIIKRGGAAGHRYWRFNFAGMGSSIMAVAEIQLMIGGVDQIPTMSSGTTSGVTMSASLTTGGGGAAWNSGDNNAGDYTTGWFQNTSTAAQWLKVDFGAGNDKAITSYSVQASNNVASWSCPTAWELEWSDDDSSWTAAGGGGSKTGLSWGNSEVKTYTI